MDNTEKTISILNDAAKELERKIKANQAINDQMIAYYVLKGEKKRKAYTDI